MGTNEFEKDKVFSFTGSVEYSDAAIVSKTVIKKNAGNISLFAFDKGEGLTEHTAAFDALVQVIDGKAEIRINGNPRLVESGQSIILPANIPHALKAIVKFKMILTMIKDA
jgi:quercetin dioxygenase-like cupin family protein